MRYIKRLIYAYYFKNGTAGNLLIIFKKSSFKKYEFIE